MAQSVSQFLNRNAAVQGLKYSPAAQRRGNAGLGENTFQAQQSPRSLALQNRLSNVRSRSEQATSIAAESAMQKRAAEEKARQEAAAKAAEQARAKQQAELDRTKAQLESRQNNDQGTFSQPKDYGKNTGSNFDLRSKIVQNAESLIGTPYAWGGGGYNSRGTRGVGKGTQNVVGVDCSGLTSYAYGAIGVKLPRVSDRQLASGVKTRVSKAKPGDLIGWGPGGHVAIYAGNGYIIEAVKPGVKAKKRKLTSSDYNRGVYAVSLQLKGE